MSGGAERFVVNRAALRAALQAVAPFASTSKDDPDLGRLVVLALGGHLSVMATDRFSWAVASMRLTDSVPGVPDEVDGLCAWSLDAGSAKAITQVIKPPSGKDERLMWESLDALVSLDTAAEGEGARVRVEEVGEFAGGREVAVEISVEAGPAASAAPARAVPNIAAGLLNLAADEVDERRVSGDRLGQMKAAASALDDVIRYAHRGDWLVGTCGRLVMGVYAPAERVPEPGSGGFAPGVRLDGWRHDLRAAGKAIKDHFEKDDQAGPTNFAAHVLAHGKGSLTIVNEEPTP